MGDLIRKIIEAIKMKMMLNRLSRAKENALRGIMGLPPRMSWYEQCSERVSVCVKDKLCMVFCPCCIYDKERKKKVPSCWRSSTLKEFIGFCGGMILTITFFLLITWQLHADPATAAYVCGVAGCALTLVMAFSTDARCLVLLMVPQFFSGKGRVLLLLYATFLAMNYPMANINKNIAVMSNSVTCGQEAAMNETKDLVKAAAAPMATIMDGVRTVLKKLRQFGNTLKQTYTTLKKTVTEIGSVVKKVGDFLTGMEDRCNEKIGQPYKKCKEKFHEGYEDCRDKLGILSGVCNVVKYVSEVCGVVKVGQLLCIVVGAIGKLLASAVDMPTVRVLAAAEEMFYFNVSLNYQFNYTISQSKSYKQIKEDISKEIHSYLNVFVGMLGVFKNAMFLTVLFVLVQALYYRTRWIVEDRYDNQYITFTVLDLDARRKDAHKASIVPLTFEEERKYIWDLDGQMTKSELRKLAFGVVMYVTSALNALFYMFCDAGLYSALHLIETHFGVKTSPPPVPPHTKLKVLGTGPMADMYRAIVGMFDPIAKTNVNLDLGPCVPRPSEPDWKIYQLIGFLLFSCLILTIFEAYGLRLRHVIMASYYPRRERRRAIWLFNHIMKTRGGLMEGVRLKLRGRAKGEVNVHNISIKGRLAAMFPILEKVFKCFGWEVKSCLYCGKEGKPDDFLHFIHCNYYDCDAIYCLACYADLDNMCPVCNQTVEIRNVSDTDEKDSSIDDDTKKKQKYEKRKRDETLKKLEFNKRPSQIMGRFRNKMGFMGMMAPGATGGQLPVAEMAKTGLPEAAKAPPPGGMSKFQAKDKGQRLPDKGQGKAVKRKRVSVKGDKTRGKNTPLATRNRVSGKQKPADTSVNRASDMKKGKSYKWICPKCGKESIRQTGKKFSHKCEAMSMSKSPPRKNSLEKDQQELSSQKKSLRMRLFARKPNRVPATTPQSPPGKYPAAESTNMSPKRFFKRTMFGKKSPQKSDQDESPESTPETDRKAKRGIFKTKFFGRKPNDETMPSPTGKSRDALSKSQRRSFRTKLFGRRAVDESTQPLTGLTPESSPETRRRTLGLKFFGKKTKEDLSRPLTDQTPETSPETKKKRFGSRFFDRKTKEELTKPLTEQTPTSSPEAKRKWWQRPKKPTPGKGNESKNADTFIDITDIIEDYQKGRAVGYYAHYASNNECDVTYSIDQGTYSDDDKDCAGGYNSDDEYALAAAPVDEEYDSRDDDVYNYGGNNNYNADEWEDESDEDYTGYDCDDEVKEIEDDGDDNDHLLLHLNRNINAIPYDDTYSVGNGVNKTDATDGINYTINTEAGHDVIKCESDDSDVTSGSSVDSDCLDYSYQEKKHLTLPLSSSDDEDDYDFEPRKRKLDLVTYDIYSSDSDSEWSSEYDSESSKEGPCETPYEPLSEIVCRS